MMTRMAGAVEQEDVSSGGRLVAVDGRVLPLRSAALEAEARGGVARVKLVQRFANAYSDPLEVTYQLPLPADGAVSGFAFRIGDRRVVGEVDRKGRARERYEQAILDGRTAALVAEERSSLFTQSIGNIPAGAEVVAEITIDQRLAWLDEGAWEWRFPTTVGPRYSGAPGRVADAHEIAVDVADGPTGARLSLTLAVRDRLPQGRKPESPSHHTRAVSGASAVTIALADDAGVALDRDVVVRWPVTEPRVGLTLDAGRPAAGHAAADRAFGLLTLVPPSLGSGRALPRDLIVLLDTSGSMGGEPLAQMQRVVGALIDSLGEQDRLEMIEFSDEPRRWKRGAVAATASARKDAHKWVRGLRSSGGTEMRSGILEALAPLGAEAQRQVVLLTDGQIGFESEIVRAISDQLPGGSRVHTVGIGSAVNRSLTSPAARAGRGVEVIVGIGEDPERAARRILARTAAPLVVELALSGSALVGHAPARLPDLYRGAPVVVGVELSPEGGNLVLEARTAEGRWSERMSVPAMDRGQGNAAAAALFAREAVEDLELQLASGKGQREIDPAVEQLGVTFQIATRLTSWIAVSEERTVDPTAPTRSERMPHELPHGVSVEGLRLRAAGGAAPSGSANVTRAGMVSREALAELQKMRDEGWAQGAAHAAAPPPPSGQPSYAPPSARAPSSGGTVEKAKKVASNLMGRVRDAFGGGGPSEPSQPPAPPRPAPTTGRMKTLSVDGAPPREETDDELRLEEKEIALEAKGGAAGVELRGRIVQRDGQQLVIEIGIDATLAWPLAEAVLVEWGAAVLRLVVDVTRSTRAGQLEAGQRARLVVRLDASAPSDAPSRILMQSAEGSVIIRL